MFHGAQRAWADGTRQATLLLPQRTSASMLLPNGSTQAHTGLHVRATEYGVGGSGGLPSHRRARTRTWCQYVEEHYPLNFGPEQPAYGARLEREHANLRQALSWSIDTGRFDAALRLAGVPALVLVQQWLPALGDAGARARSSQPDAVGVIVNVGLDPTQSGRT